MSGKPCGRPGPEVKVIAKISHVPSHAPVTTSMISREFTVHNRHHLMGPITPPQQTLLKRPNSYHFSQNICICKTDWVRMLYEYKGSPS